MKFKSAISKLSHNKMFHMFRSYELLNTTYFSSVTNTLFWTLLLKEKKKKVWSLTAICSILTLKFVYIGSRNVIYSVVQCDSFLTLTVCVLDQPHSAGAVTHETKGKIKTQVRAATIIDVAFVFIYRKIINNKLQL